MIDDLVRGSDLLGTKNKDGCLILRLENRASVEGADKQHCQDEEHVHKDTNLTP
jgi:hypothetical protein